MKYSYKEYSIDYFLVLESLFFSYFFIVGFSINIFTSLANIFSLKFREVIISKDII